MCTAIDCPANFVFGDSLVEVGNNNYIPSLSKADYPPNGIDFGRPNGRYTNGRTVIDIIGESDSGFQGVHSSLLSSYNSWISNSEGCQLCFRWRWNS
ncbi:hypothetical protein ACLB2K_037246 [Fragaria x ananassa]